MAWRAGYVTLFGLTGFAGFAQAGEVKDLKDQQVRLEQKIDNRANDIMAVVIGGQIFELRTKECAARKAHNDDAAAAYSQQRQSQMDLYQQMAKRAYPLEGCS